MAISCNVCNEEKELFTRCQHCNLRICLDCILNLYQAKADPPVQLFPSAGTCPTCWQHFDEAILLYIREHPDEAPIFVSVSLQYSPWNEVLKDILRGEIRGQRLFDTVNRCIGIEHEWRL